MNTKKIIGVVAVAILLLAGSIIGSRIFTASPTLATQVQNDDWYFSGKTEIAPPGMLTTDIGATTSLNAQLYAHAGVVKGGLSAINLATTTINLVVSNLLGTSDIEITGSSTANTTVTFPASSTIPTYEGFAGDTEELIIHNSSNAAAATVLLAPGTGWTLRASSAASSTIGANKSADVIITHLASSTYDAFIVANE